jgi:predicted phage terminase large subunit-like protein
MSVALSGNNISMHEEDKGTDSLSIMQLAKQLRQVPLGSMDLRQIRQSDLTNLQRLLTPKMTKYIPHVPTPKQAAFLLLDTKEAFYGGAAGGGKSDALLMGGLQYVDVKGYAGIIFRETYADLTKPGALIDRAKEWLFKFEDVRWNEKDKKFEFFERYGPHKEVISILQFGYLESANDKYNYQGGEYQFIGFDELTHINKDSYLYMFSRLRRLKGSPIPLRVRSASNPPDDGDGLWVKTRFIDEGPDKGRIFIPAGMDDNPYLDVEQYEESLEELDPVTRSRLRDGNWDIIRKGNMFKREWFQPVSELPPYRKRVRFWDMAATDEEKAKKRNKSNEPDFTVGFLMSRWQDTYYIEDIIRVRKRPEGTEQLQKSTASADGYSTVIREEREPGSAGIALIDSKKRNLLSGFNYDEVHSTGSKTDRANPFSAAAERGQIKYLAGCRNIEIFFNEAEAFPGGTHDDTVDGGSGAFGVLNNDVVQGEPLIVTKSEFQESIWTGSTERTSGYFTQDFARMF